MRLLRRVLWVLMLDIDPARAEWWRVLQGGRWERWWIGAPFNAPIWLDDWDSALQGRPPLGEDLLAVERR